MKAIIAVNLLGWIGKDGKLPWAASLDLAHFKKLTMGGRLLVGYKTANNLPVLNDRELVIYDRNKPDEFYDDIDWCIGGKYVYEKFCYKFTEIHISTIEDTTIGDVSYPDFTNINPECKIFRYYFKIDTCSTSS